MPSTWRAPGSLSAERSRSPNSLSPWPWACAILGALVVSGSATAYAQTGSGDVLHEDTEQFTRLLQDLASPQSQTAEQARDDLVGAGPRLAPRLIDEIAKAAPSLYRDRLGGVLSAFVESWILDIQSSFNPASAQPSESASAAVGGLTCGSSHQPEPDTTPPSANLEAAKRARAGLRAASLPTLRFLLEVPPLRSREVALELEQLAAEIYEDTASSLEDMDQPSRQRLRTRLVALADLIAPAIRAGIDDERPPVKSFFDETADQAISEAVSHLAHADSTTRERHRQRLFLLGEVAVPRLQQLAGSSSNPEIRYHAARLFRRIRFGVSETLYDRIGHTLENYDQLDFRSRRKLCLELERLGQKQSVPALRRIVASDSSRAVRIFAATCLARIGDWVGPQVLRREGEQGPLPLSSDLLVAIWMDQGLKYLQIRRYELAIKEFTLILAVQPKNDTALYNLACAYSLWKRIPEALDFLERAVKNGFTDVEHMEKDTDLDNIRQEDRYRTIVERLRRKLSPSDNPSGNR